jgi:ATP-dependent DNA ligase
MMQQLAPMLAVAGEPFDSSDHLFEIKWDGIRSLACVERRALWLWGRGQADYTHRYPELDALRQLPEGTILDGELVRLRAGRAEFSAVLRRHQLTSPRKIRWAVERHPVTYMVFDLLRLNGRCLLRQPLRDRRARLRELLAASSTERVLFSEGVTGSGVAFFDAAIEQQHEGVMAKRLDSRYLPGKRAATWQKIDRKSVV